MTFFDTVRPGDKIDIHLVQKTAQTANKVVLGSNLYKSTVSDIVSNLEIEILVPIDGSKMMLFPAGVRLDLVFYTRRGLYHCHGRVKGRYKKNNLYLLFLEQATRLERFQRREYFRVSCFQELRFYRITEEEAALPTTRELQSLMLDPENVLELSYGKLMDISGGGVRFEYSEGFEPGTFILSDFDLKNDRVERSFCLVTEIVASEMKKGTEDRYVNRAKFIYKDLSDRELIVRYVFEEERRLRRTEIR